MIDKTENCSAGYTVTYDGLTVSNKLVAEQDDQDNPESRPRPSHKPDPKPVEVIKRLEFRWKKFLWRKLLCLTLLWQ